MCVDALSGGFVSFTRRRFSLLALSLSGRSDDDDDDDEAAAARKKSVVVTPCVHKTQFYPLLLFL